MLSKRIIACLDVRDGKVVKGVKFKNHEILGDILPFSERYRNQGVDELVFYDITASSDRRTVGRQWVSDVAALIDIPFCVAGGIRTVEDAREILNQGADKISINSPALENPKLISEMAEAFGSQCVVVGIDSLKTDSGYSVYQYTGSEKTIQGAGRSTMDWAVLAQEMGAGEIVLNCMDQDGVRRGYDLEQLAELRSKVTIPVIASGGAGAKEHFLEVFQKTGVDGALAAGVFHRKEIEIGDLKAYLAGHGVEVRR